jgi:hypothetical protein
LADCSTAAAPTFCIPVTLNTAMPPPVEVPGAWVKVVETAAPMSALRTWIISLSTRRAFRARQDRGVGTARLLSVGVAAATLPLWAVTMTIRSPDRWRGRDGLGARCGVKRRRAEQGDPEGQLTPPPRLRRLTFGSTSVVSVRTGPKNSVKPGRAFSNWSSILLLAHEDDQGIGFHGRSARSAGALGQLDPDQQLLEQRLDLAVVRVVDQQRAVAVGDLAVAKRGRQLGLAAPWWALDDRDRHLRFS